MAEFVIPQRSEVWFELRKSVCLTASHFGDALGVGRGKPYDFLQALLFPDDHDIGEEESEACRHGCNLEPLINGAYQKLTGRRTKPSGFWVATERHGALSGLIGASPDAKVYQVEGDGSESLVGLAEYKAPLYKMFIKSSCPGVSHCVPRRYMAQVHGQMALSGLRWCDFMAVCSRTQEMMLCRVHFSSEYWQNISDRLLTFCNVLQEARKRLHAGCGEVLGFAAAEELRGEGMREEPFHGEEEIFVEDLLDSEKISQQLISSIFLNLPTSSDHLQAESDHEYWSDCNSIDFCEVINSDSDLKQDAVLTNGSMVNGECHEQGHGQQLLCLNESPVESDSNVQFCENSDFNVLHNVSQYKEVCISGLVVVDSSTNFDCH